MRYSLQQVHHRSILLPLLRLTPPTEGFPMDDLRKILHGGQMITKVHSGEEILLSFNLMSWTLQIVDRQTTDGYAIANIPERNVT